MPSPIISPIEIAEDHPVKRMIGGEFHGAWLIEFDGRTFGSFMTRDDIGLSVPDLRWHISVAGRDKAVPPWGLLAAMGHELRPGVPFVLGVPPKSWWLNVHPGTLHLYETKDAGLVDSWRMQRRGDAPS